MKTIIRNALGLLLFSSLLQFSTASFAQTGSFTYQGRITDSSGNPATGPVNLSIAFYRSATGGFSILLGPITFNNIALANGVFTQEINLGNVNNATVFNGQDVWIEITDTTHGIVFPRQHVTFTPYALVAASAATAATATIATNLAGNVSDALLSTNIPRLNGTNIFIGPNNFNGVTQATNVNNVFTGTFTGNGGGLSNLNASQLTSGAVPSAVLTSVPVASLTGTIAQAQFPSAISFSNLSVSATNQIAPLTVAPIVPTNALGVAGGGGVPSSLAVAGGYAYVANNSSVQIISVGNPIAPAVLSSNNENANAIAVAGRYAYAANESSLTFDVLDVGNLTGGAVAVGSVHVGPNLPAAVAVSGHYAYMVSIGTDINNGNPIGVLQIFDVSTPSAPVSVGSVIVGPFPAAVTVAGRYAYVAENGADPLQIVDVGNPSAPAIVGQAPAPSGNVTGMAVAGNYAYLVTANMSNLPPRLMVFDVSKPTSPSNVGLVNVGIGNTNFVDYVSAVAAAGRYVYVATTTYYNYNPPQAPILLEPGGMLFVLDVGNPTAPVSLGSVFTGFNPTSVAVVGRNAYVVDNNGLEIFDMGGAYLQQLEAGTTVTGSLQTRDTATVGNDLDVRGGLTVSGSARISGGLSADNGVISAASFSGNGAGLTNVTAAQLAAGPNFNFFAGPSAGNPTTSGFANSGFGNSSLTLNANGNQNTAVGYGSLAGNTSGSGNTAVGAQSMNNNASGANNTAVGSGALNSLSSGANNAAFGVNALGDVGNGNNNIGLGYQGGLNVTGSSNIDIGNFGFSGENNTIRIGTPGTHTNTFIAGVINGNGAGLTNITATQLAGGGNFNLFAGPSAGNQTMSGFENSAFGNSTLTLNANGNQNTAVGYGSLAGNTSGSGNTAVGVQSMNNNSSGANNTAVGSGALNSLGSGANNAAFGVNALGDVGNGNNNIGLGYQGGLNVTGSSNIDIGNFGLSGENNTIRIGSSTHTNTFIAGVINGNGAGLTNVTAAQLAGGANFNLFAGPSAGNLTTSGSANTAFGNSSLTLNTSGSQNTAVGYGSLAGNTSGSGNTAVGVESMNINTSGANNTAVGNGALNSLSSGANNAAFGVNALGDVGNGNNNIGLGFQAGLNLTGSGNIDIGNFGFSGENNTIRIGSGTQTATFIAGVINGNGGGLTNLNVSASQLTSGPGNNSLFVGPSGNPASTAANDTAVGSQALSANTVGHDNTATGFKALTANVNGPLNTAYGSQALGANISGGENTAIGAEALQQTTTAPNNTAVGYATLSFLAGGTNNIALGSLAGSSFTGVESSNIDIGNVGVTGESGVIRIGTAQNNTYIAGVINGNGGGLTNLNINASQLGSGPGNNSLFVGPSGNPTSTAANDTAVGSQALSANTVGHDNTATGFKALTANVNGPLNTAYGAQALGANISGGENTAIGAEALQQTTTAPNNTAVGYATLSFLVGGTNNIALGYQAGSFFSGVESSNIDIGNVGVTGESGVIRIGTAQNNTFIAGVINGNGAGLTNLNINASQLGSGPGNNSLFVGPSGNPASTAANDTAVGSQALSSNTVGHDNTATGFKALTANVNGPLNTAYGSQALGANISGGENTAIGAEALQQTTTAPNNTAVGYATLSFLAGGTNNIALGSLAGSSFTGVESSNIDIGNVGVTGESGVIRIGTAQNNTFIAGVINGDGGGLTDLNASQLTGSLPAISGANLTSIPAGKLTGALPAISGASLISLTASNLSGTVPFANLPTSLITNGQSGVTLGGPLNITSPITITAGGGKFITSPGGGANIFVGVGSGNTNGLTGGNNSGFGQNALAGNTSGGDNTGLGYTCMVSNLNGTDNTAVGFEALFKNTSGGQNIAIGSLAGQNITTTSGNIDIGNSGSNSDSGVIRIGSATQTGTFIAGISGVTASGGAAVFVTSTGQLGTVTSSARFKEDIQTMDDASDVLLALRPVTFKYKPDIDPKGIPQFGLVAEEVEKADPDLVLHDEQGKIYTVRYEAVNAMLLNEFLKEHKTVEEQKARIQTLELENDGMAKRLEKVEQAVQSLGEKK